MKKTSHAQAKNIIKHPARLTITYLLLAAIAAVSYWLADLFGGDYMVFRLSDVWLGFKNAGSAVISVFFLFLYAGSSRVLLYAVLKHKRRYRIAEPSTIIWRGTYTNVHAAICEELVYRGFVLMALMPALVLLNYITLGVLQPIFEEVLLPVANWMTLGLLSDWLNHSEGWILGAAILTSNFVFAITHLDLPPRTQIYIWFFGMIMFWTLFQYGLFAAIIVHFLHNMLILGIDAVGNALLPKQRIYVNELAYYILQAPNQQRAHPL